MLLYNTIDTSRSTGELVLLNINCTCALYSPHALNNGGPVAKRALVLIWPSGKKMSYEVLCDGSINVAVANRLYVYCCNKDNLMSLA